MEKTEKAANAATRLNLANERTLLSYIRSSLYLLLGGIGILQLKDFESIKWLGYVALAVCVIFLAVGIFRYVLLSRRLYKWNRILYVDTISEKVQKQVDTQDKMQNEKVEA